MSRGTFTLETGLGMLGVGLLTMGIIAAVAFYIINNHIKKGDKHDSRS